MILYNFIICQFAALFPLVTSQAWLRSDVLEPQPGLTTGESRMFLALGVLDRFPVVPSASLHNILYNFIICQFAALFPLVTSQAWLRSDVLEPQPGLTTGESRMFLALDVLDRFPAVPSASLHRLGFMSWLRWLGS